MSKINFKRGIRRIVWIIALLGLLVGLAVSIEAIITQIDRAKENQRTLETKDKIAKGDPKYEALSNEAKIIVDQEIQDKINQYEKNKDRIWQGILFGLLWFGFIWALYFLSSWVIKGFLTE